MKIIYTSPVDQLLTYGDCTEMPIEWPNYLELGFTQEHVSELIRMVADENLHCPEFECIEMWSVIHAWRTLAQLKVIEVVDTLLELLSKRSNDSDEWFDEWLGEWLGEEFIDVVMLIGSPSISIIEKCLKNEGADAVAKDCVSESLLKLGQAYPEERDRCVKITTELLENCRNNDPTFNAFLIRNLLNFNAVESLEEIRLAYSLDLVNLFFCGDIEDVEIAFGIRTERETPAPKLKGDMLMLSKFMNLIEENRIDLFDEEEWSEDDDENQRLMLSKFMNLIEENKIDLFGEDEWDEDDENERLILSKLMNLFEENEIDLLGEKEWEEWEEWEEKEWEEDEWYEEEDEDFGLYDPPKVNIPVQKKEKIGRNAPCPCGSGKKYKKCCLKKS